MANPFEHIPTPNKTPKTPFSPTTVCPPHLKSVFLHEWWLIKVENDSNGRQLGIGGYLSSERQGTRAFCSAAISKRRDDATLETVDGITIKVSGLINGSRTQENGFPYEVWNQFWFGFPFDWEEIPARTSGEESTNRTNASRTASLDANDGSKSSLPTTFDDLPVTQVRDLIMSTAGGPEANAVAKIILDDLLQKLGGHIPENSGAQVNLDEKTYSMDSGRKESGRSRKKTKV